MENNNMLEKYLNSLLLGDRQSARKIIAEAMQCGRPAVNVYMDLIWPIMLEIDKLSRADRITPAQEHLASRINRTIVDQLQNKLPRKEAKNKKVVVCSADGENNELGGQIIADLFESDGWDVKFLGGGMTSEDIMSFVHEFRPQFLVIYGTKPQQAPAIRALIDRIRQINAISDMKIMLSGGIFARNEGLWEEIGADMYAETAPEAVELACAGEKSAEKPKRMINARKRRKEELERIASK